MERRYFYRGKVQNYIFNMTVMIKMTLNEWAFKSKWETNILSFQIFLFWRDFAPFPSPPPLLCLDIIKALFGLMELDGEERNEMEWNDIPLFGSFKIRWSGAE